MLSFFDESAVSMVKSEGIYLIFGLTLKDPMREWKFMGLLYVVQAVDGYYSL